MPALAAFPASAPPASARVRRESPSASPEPRSPRSRPRRGLGDHAELLDAGAANLVHGLDDEAVLERLVGLEVERLVRAVLEHVAQRLLEGAHGQGLAVQIELLFPGQ